MKSNCPCNIHLYANTDLTVAIPGTLNVRHFDKTVHKRRAVVTSQAAPPHLGVDVADQVSSGVYIFVSTDKFEKRMIEKVKV